jgi:hypothetical protein
MDQAKLARMQASVRIGTFYSFLWIFEVLVSESVFSADGLRRSIRSFERTMGNVMSRLSRSELVKRFRSVTDS